VKYRFIALLTDFGEDDFFVASLKAVIAKINPSARVIDVTHRIPSFDTGTASFILFSCYRYFPAGTIFLTVVDPGVGSSRRILLAETEHYLFIAPDNGVLSRILEEEDGVRVRELKNKKYFLPEPSRTFEARDKMAPAAAWLSKGVAGSEFGPWVSLFKKFRIQKPRLRGKEIIGHVLYTDKFGNLITDIPAEMLDLLGAKTGKRSFVLRRGKKEIASFQESYSSVKKGETLFLIGSLGWIEISAREASASQKLKIKNGDAVKITGGSRR
jgi:S-adenosylmethionine hydrolase